MRISKHSIGTHNFEYHFLNGYKSIVWESQLPAGLKVIDPLKQQLQVKEVNGLGFVVCESSSGADKAYAPSELRLS